MADGPVDGQGPETDTGRTVPAQAEDAAAREAAPAEPGAEPAAELEPESVAEPESDSAEAEQSEQDQDAVAEPGPEPASGKSPFDVFAAGQEPLPFSEAPDIEAEVEQESLAEGGGAEPVQATAQSGEETELDELEDPDDTQDPDDLLSAFGPPQAEPDLAIEVDEEPAAPVDDELDYGSIPAAPPPSEAEETTLIPKVTDRPGDDATSVLPPVPAPTSNMVRRPYSEAPAGYGRPARPTWGAVQAAADAPDAQPTQVSPRVAGEDANPTQVQPAVLAPLANGNGRGYKPPEFHKVDASRSQLPPPQNFRLDRRELDAAADAEGGRKFGRRAMLVGGAVAVVGVGGLAAAGVLKVPGTAPKLPTTGFSPSANSGASNATQTGTAFLTAWQSGNLEAAANLTDNPTEALAAFKWYKANLGVVGMVVNPDAANGVGWMPFSVSTQAGSPMGQWSYQSGFAAYSKQINGYTRWFVQWTPAILYASLKAGYQLKITKTAPSITGVVDRNGTVIQPSAHPALAGLVTTLTQTAKVSGGTPGQVIIMVDKNDKQLATVATLTNPINNGTVKTTLDMKVQSAAETAVTSLPNSSMVIIQPSTGNILAIANNTTSQYRDDALKIQVAPGSTFKIITSTALLANGITTLNSNAPCPTQLTIGTVTLKNSEGDGGPGQYTYEQDFSQSCNNAFSLFYSNPKVTPDLLPDTAAKYFGLNQKWDIGLNQPTQYMTIPTNLSGAGLAETLVGQNTVVSCPLAMCSVASTVANGSFKQPILIPGYKQTPATALGSGLQGELKTLMGQVIINGTGAGIGFPKNGHYFAKTGTAEVVQGGPTNAWFVIFNDVHDMCIGGVSVAGGFGAAAVGPQTLSVFKKLFPGDF